MPIVWHYAPWTYLPQIVKAGSLQPSMGAIHGDLPLLWFSANQVWEPTATKLAGNARGNLFMLTFDEQVRLLGCIRFGLCASDHRLMTWGETCAYARTTAENRRLVERSGRGQGAKPSDWSASSKPVPLTDLKLEVRLGGWQPVEGLGEIVGGWREHAGCAALTYKH